MNVSCVKHLLFKMDSMYVLESISYMEFIAWWFNQVQLTLQNIEKVLHFCDKFKYAPLLVDVQNLYYIFLLLFAEVPVGKVYSRLFIRWYVFLFFLTLSPKCFPLLLIILPDKTESFQ
jgi:hypothetical protein